LLTEAKKDVTSSMLLTNYESERREKNKKSFRVEKGEEKSEMNLEESPGNKLSFTYSQKDSWIKMKSGKYTFHFASPTYLAIININKA